MKNRLSNIELARIISMCGVIILHYNNPNIGGALSYATDPLNHVLLQFLESAFICAVNLFVLISGYFMCKSNKRNITKPLQLLVQVIIFSVMMYLLDCLFGMKTFTVVNLVFSFIPANWFVLLYITLYFISPYINLVLSNLDKNTYKTFLVTLFIFFSIIPFIIDFVLNVSNVQILGLSTISMYGNQNGYSIVQFVVMYSLGAYLNFYRIETSSKRNGVKYLIISIILTFMSIMSIRLNLSNEWVFEYCNPFIILESIYLFLFFKSLPIKSNSIINKLANSSFSVYLLHIPMLKYFNISAFAKQNLIALMMHIIFTILCIYLISFVINFCYEKIMIKGMSLLTKR